MNAHARAEVRIFRVPSSGRRKDGQLILDHRGQLYDLSSYLMRRGQPDDLVELAESGWFDSAQLTPLLPAPDTGEEPPEASEADSAADVDAHEDDSSAQENRSERPNSEWEKVDLEWDGNAPSDVLTPLKPSRVGKILCLGKNFRAHALEFGEEVPSEMLFFNKLPETLVPHRATVSIEPGYTRRVDHEAELVVVIGLAGKAIAVEDALEHVAGYSVANDLTARSLQGDDRKNGHPWFRSKNMDGFCPFGPCFIPRDFLALEDLELSATVNNETRQSSTLGAMVIDVPNAIAQLSSHLTLRPGDLVLMGTPAGVSALNDGDEVVCSIDGIGSLSTLIHRPAQA
ncbi:MAG: 2-keto-4-pentenoate hydratase/2-oxohepta-3-ene-1,7-dioic acid hydratase in catechol pathway [Planctomycetota bacterium]|jgi:2-keto-4-pentenoate hydratase/2-oxohepta-3-ene-1,7-dioic acid hydratase in catechol pathway